MRIPQLRHGSPDDDRPASQPPDHGDQRRSGDTMADVRPRATQRGDVLPLVSSWPLRELPTPHSQRPAGPFRA
jgi:hypothetical protein